MLWGNDDLLVLLSWGRHNPRRERRAANIKNLAEGVFTLTSYSPRHGGTLVALRENKLDVLIEINSADATLQPYRTIDLDSPSFQCRYVNSSSAVGNFESTVFFASWWKPTQTGYLARETSRRLRCPCKLMVNNSEVDAEFRFTLTFLQSSRLSSWMW